MLTYRSDIDGLRALAVLSVVAFHSGIAGFSGGFSGVDVFFVISGFLLTGILVRELDNGNYTLAGFYVRRARRILPALTVVVVTTLAAGFYLMPPSQLIQTAQAAQGVATLSANIYFAQVKGDYWDQNSLADQPLLHAWSLAVEEQFYIVLPLVLCLLLKLGNVGGCNSVHKRKMLSGVLAIVAVISLLYAQWLTKTQPSDAFYLLLPRAWELLVGSLLAIWLHDRPFMARPWLREAAGSLGLALVVASFYFLNESLPFPGVSALIPCLGAALVILSGSTGAQGATQRLLSFQPLVWIGKISYSLYLWHWPVLVLVNSAGWHAWGLPRMELPLQLAAMLTLAWLSWRFVEQPFRRGAIPPKKTIPVLLVATSSLASLWACGAIAGRIALEGQPIAMPTPPLLIKLDQDRRSTPGIICEGSADAKTIDLNGGGCPRGIGTETPLFALLGDSHARMYAEGLDVLLRENNASAVIIARSSCVPALGFEPATRRECRDLTAASLGFLTRSDIEVIVLAGYWVDSARDDDQANQLKQSLDETITKLVTSDKRVVLLMDVPELKDDLHAYRGAIQSIRAGGSAVSGLSLLEHHKAQLRAYRLLNELSKKHDLSIIDPADTICVRDGCLIANNGRALYRDKHHITDDASVQYRKIFNPLLHQSQGTE